MAQPACHRQLEQVDGVTCRLPGRQCLASKCLPKPKVYRNSAVSGAHYTSLRCHVQVVQKVEFPMWIVYGSQNLMFGGGLLGITYGIMSTSWDPTREGSVSQCQRIPT